MIIIQVKNDTINIEKGIVTSNIPGLQNIINIIDKSPSMGDIDYVIAQKIINLVGGKIIKYEPPEYEKGVDF